MSDKITPRTVAFLLQSIATRRDISGMEEAAVLAAAGIMNKINSGQIVELPEPVKDDYPGSKVKYRVFKAEDNSPVENCFVLRPDRDPAARIALSIYAVYTENQQLKKDINGWLDKLDRQGNDKINRKGGSE